MKRFILGILCVNTILNGSCSNGSTALVEKRSTVSFFTREKHKTYNASQIRSIQTWPSFRGQRPMVRIVINCWPEDSSTEDLLIHILELLNNVARKNFDVSVKTFGKLAITEDSQFTKYRQYKILKPQHPIDSLVLEGRGIESVSSILVNNLLAKKLELWFMNHKLSQALKNSECIKYVECISLFCVKNNKYSLDFSAANRLHTINVNSCNCRLILPVSNKFKLMHFINCNIAESTPFSCVDYSENIANIKVAEIRLENCTLNGKTVSIDYFPHVIDDMHEPFKEIFKHAQYIGVVNHDGGI